MNDFSESSLSIGRELVGCLLFGRLLVVIINDD